MKKLIITTLILIASIASAAEVNLNIDYNVDGVPFEFDKEYVNKNGVKYKISRFQYYMCQFELDDNLLEGTYVLANAGLESYSLGNIDISNVNNISLSFGVEEEENIGKDPNRFGMFHPLAPKNPSMHWGWSAGYRFWAIEGFSDPDGDGEYDKSIQYHILGDESFRTLSFTVNAQEVDGTIDIMLDFDIQELLAPVDMTTFGIYHEFYNNSQQVRDLIDNFGESDVVTSETTTSVELSQSISISPNPTTDYLNVDAKHVNSDFEIISLNGNVVQTGSVNSSIIEIIDLTVGTYFLRILDNSGVIKTAKFVKK
jgi:hypothetical protein